MRRFPAALLAILVIGFGLRVWSFQLNWFMHGDVILDASTSALFHRDGELLAFEGPSEGDPKLHPLASGVGEPLKLHGPLVPVAASLVTTLYRGNADMPDAFFSLKILSLLCGTLSILLAFLIASKLSGRDAGLAAAALVAISYILIDYSGNGSLYTVQATIYLAWIWVALSQKGWIRALLFGLLCGIGYLTNFQCLILVPASVFSLMFSSRSWKSWFFESMLLGALALLIVSPWLVHSYHVFGDPLYSHAFQMRYVYGKAGLSVPEHDLLIPTFAQKIVVLKHMFFLWLPNNLYYVARKLFVIAPIAFFFFAYGLIDIAFDKKRFKTLFPILILLAAQTVLGTAWPVWKFRFFALILPLIFILAIEQVSHLTLSKKQKHACMFAILGALVVINIFTYRAVPTHTTYYDGAMTEDPFGSSEEMRYLQDFHILPADAK